MTSDAAQSTLLAHDFSSANHDNLFKNTLALAYSPLVAYQTPVLGTGLAEVVAGVDGSELPNGEREDSNQRDSYVAADCPAPANHIGEFDNYVEHMQIFVVLENLEPLYDWQNYASTIPDEYAALERRHSYNSNASNASRRSRVSAVSFDQVQ